MASFGKNLKREREMRGIPLHEISASTKINLHFLQALEDEEFDKLPGGVFNRGFIRAYSRHLGLDEQTFLGEYDLVLGRKEPFETPCVLAAPPPPLEATSSQAQLLATAIAVVMLFIGYTLYRYSDQPSTTETPSEIAPTVPEQTPAAGESSDEAGPPSGPAPAQPVRETPRQAAAQPAITTPAPQPRTPTPAPTPAASHQEASSAPATEPAATAGDSTDTPAAGTSAPEPSAPSTSEGLVLQIATTEQAWVSIKADGRTVVQRTLEADATRTFRAKKFFQVWTGNAGGLILTLNGEKLAPLGNRPGQVRSIRLTRENLPSGNP